MNEQGSFRQTEINLGTREMKIFKTLANKQKRPFGNTVSFTLSPKIKVNSRVAKYLVRKMLANRITT